MNCLEILSLLKDTDVDAYEELMRWVKPIVIMKLSVLKEGEIVHPKHFKLSISKMMDIRQSRQPIHANLNSELYREKCQTSRYYLKYLQADLFNSTLTKPMRLDGDNYSEDPFNELTSWRRGSSAARPAPAPPQAKSGDINLFGINLYSSRCARVGHLGRGLTCPSTKEDLFNAAKDANIKAVKKSWPKTKMLTYMINHQD
tara:strand:+ start:30 stop:632 length:603 start_codon:yes stop_codon:yes gene_type:complete